MVQDEESNPASTFRAGSCGQFHFQPPLMQELLLCNVHVTLHKDY